MSIKKGLTYISSYAINLALALWESHTVGITELQFCAVSFAIFFIISILINCTPMHRIHFIFSQALFFVTLFIVYGHADIGIIGLSFLTFLNLLSQSIALMLTILIKNN